MSVYYPLMPPDFLREINLPDYGVQVTTFGDGYEVRTSANSTGAGLSLILEYQNRTALEWATFSNFYRGVRGPYRAFYLPVGLLRHPPPLLEAIINSTQSVWWRFGGPSQVTTRFRDCYDWKANLVSVPFNRILSPVVDEETNLIQFGG